MRQRLNHIPCHPRGRPSWVRGRSIATKAMTRATVRKTRATQAQGATADAVVEVGREEESGAADTAEEKVTTSARRCKNS